MPDMTACADLAGAALVACLARDPACLPPQHAHLLPLILSTVRQESAAAPYVVRNEAEGRAHPFSTWEAAVAYAIAADARGDVLGLGLGQITHRANWRLHTGTEDTAAGRREAIARLLRPCDNLRATASHYAIAYDASVAFNAGGRRMGNPPTSSAAYAQRVLAGAVMPQPVPTGQSAAPPAAPPTSPRGCVVPEWDPWAECPPEPPPPSERSIEAPASEPVLLRGLAMGTPSE
jgi:hypothetical protein